MEATYQLAGAEVLGREAAREQPAFSSGTHGRRLGVERSDVVVQRWRHLGRDLPEPERYRAPGDLHMLGGEGDDPGRVLREEESEESRRLVGHGDLVVVDEPADQLPARVLSDELAGEGGRGEFDGKGGV
ncbi:hypothetical protein [Streptomyces ardesiacus]|uniref:hypothetical protein n=1 Tax=Streptomyces ardesiacus TaxID=285564 RepID=UPI0036503425